MHGGSISRLGFFVPRPGTTTMRVAGWALRAAADRDAAGRAGPAQAVPVLAPGMLALLEACLAGGRSSGSGKMKTIASILLIRKG